MKRNGYLVIGVLLAVIAAMGWVMGQQRQQIARLEQSLAMDLANDFSSVFTNLYDIPGELARWIEAGEVTRHELDRMRQWAGHNSAVVNNRLSALERLGYVVPERPLHLLGYMDAFYRSLQTWEYLNPQEPMLLVVTPAQAAELRRHARVAEQLTAIIPKHYPGWKRGFPSELNYWEEFLTDSRWRALLAEMDRAAEEAGYPPRR